MAGSTTRTSTLVLLLVLVTAPLLVLGNALPLYRVCIWNNGASGTFYPHQLYLKIVASRVGDLDDTTSMLLAADFLPVSWALEPGQSNCDIAVSSSAIPSGAYTWFSIAIGFDDATHRPIEADQWQVSTSASA